MQAEEACLGSLLIDPQSIQRVKLTLKPADFYIVKNGWIYEALINLGDSADLLTVSAKLAEQNLLESIGGEAYLAQLTASVPTALNVDAYAEIIAQLSTRRKLIIAASEIAKLGYDLKEDISSCLTGATKQLDAIRFSGVRLRGGKMGSAYENYTDWLEEDIKFRIKTGVPLIDATMGGGFVPNEFAVIGAAPGVGKTSLGTQIVLNALNQKLKVLVFTFEVRARDVYSRLISRSLSERGIKIPYSNAIRKNLTQAEREVFINEWTRLNSLHGDSLVVVDPSNLTPSEIKARIIAECHESPVNLVLVDHLHLMRDDQKSKDEYQRMTNISMAVREIPKDVFSITGNEITLLSMAQLSRDGYDEPDSKSFKGSGQIESDAETCVLLYLNSGNMQVPGCPNLDARKTLCVKVSKSRNGTTGKFAVQYEREYCHIR